MMEAKKPSFVYAGSIRRIVDGDTVECDVDMGIEIWKHKQALRLARVNAPELSTAEGQASAHALADHVGIPFTPGKTPTVLPVEVVIETQKDRQDPYRRYVAEIWLQGVNLSDWLVANGWAVVR